MGRQRGRRVRDGGGNPEGRFCADEWPDVDESAFQTHEVARALVAAVESSAKNKSDVILGATAVLLGEQGLAAQRAEHERIAEDGVVPLIVTLV